MQTRRFLLKRTAAAAAIMATGTASLLLTPRMALATGAVAGATEPTQLMNNVQLVLAYAKQIEQYATQLQQYKDQLQNTLNLPMQIWSDVQGQLMGVFNIVKQGEGLAFNLENIAEAFAAKFPGFTEAKNIVDSYKKWSTTWRDTLKGTLQAANMQASQFKDEETVLAKLRTMSQSNSGRMEALQTGNQIAVETATQLQQLRALSLAQMQAQNTYMAKQEQEKDTTNANIEKMLNQPKLKDKRTYPEFSGVN